MNVSEWKKKRQVTFDTPSGLTVTIKRIALVTLACNGEIPTPLHAIAQREMDSTDRNFDMDGYANFGKLIDFVCEKAMIEPTFEEVKDYLSAKDKAFIHNVCQGLEIVDEPTGSEVAQLATFPEGE